jgi:hypothetical protein
MGSDTPLSCSGMEVASFVAALYERHACLEGNTVSRSQDRRDKTPVDRSFLLKPLALNPLRGDTVPLSRATLVS